MKDLRNANYILKIQILRDKKNKIQALSQTIYIDKVFSHFSMQNFKKGLMPTRHEISLSQKQCPKTPQKEEDMKRISYALAVGSLMYTILRTRLDICYIVRIMSQFQSNPDPEHWIAVKHILKYLRRIKDYMLVYSSDNLNIQGYTDSNFQADRDSRKSTSCSMFTLGRAAVV